MNIFDKSKTSLTCWCEDCDEVYDSKILANIHASENNHHIKITEFLITSRR
jgi:hypothetical protein